jgi:hypothetical protein
MRWWGRGSLNAQARGLNKLGEMATPHWYESGRLITRDAGGEFAGSTAELWRIRMQAMLRMRTLWTDVWRNNIGANGLIFDPAIHPIAAGVLWAGSGAVAYQVLELAYYGLKLNE